MKQTAITERLQGLGNEKWQIHFLARELAREGLPIIALTIGEPDVAVPSRLIECAHQAMLQGRTGYSDGRGEIGLRRALADRYSLRAGREIKPEQCLCFPGAQSALFCVLLGAVEEGDELLVCEPMYATYEGLIRATGATLVSVPLRPENGFRLDTDDLAQRITPRTRALLLNTPHNPTGVILERHDIQTLGAFAIEHDFWIISDEVYDEMIFGEREGVSPLSETSLAERTIVISSISKSHAAPGFRSGWCVGFAAFIENLLPVAETMLFGNQPFIADMTEQAVREGSSVIAGMCERFSRRAGMLSGHLTANTSLRVHMPDAGMFALIDVSSTGMDGETYARDLLLKAHVAVMPGSAFGQTLHHWVRVALTADDQDFATACTRMVEHARACGAGGDD